MEPTPTSFADAAPLGVDRFYSLVKCHYYDGDGFFRVVPDFVTQWGINGDPGNYSQLRKGTTCLCAISSFNPIRSNVCSLGKRQHPG